MSLCRNAWNQNLCGIVGKCKALYHRLCIHYPCNYGKQLCNHASYGYRASELATISSGTLSCTRRREICSRTPSTTSLHPFFQTSPCHTSCICQTVRAPSLDHNRRSDILQYREPEILLHYTPDTPTSRLFLCGGFLWYLLSSGLLGILLCNANKCDNTHERLCRAIFPRICHRHELLDLLKPSKKP